MRGLPLKGNPPPPVNERPLCYGCDKRRIPLMHHHWERTEDGNGYKAEPSYKSWDGQYEGSGHFHSLRCAHAWAERAIAGKMSEREIRYNIREGSLAYDGPEDPITGERLRRG